MLHLLITILMLGLVFYLIYWAISRIPLPEPFGVVLQVVLAIFALIIIFELIMPLIPGGGLASCGSRLFC